MKYLFIVLITFSACSQNNSEVSLDLTTEQLKEIMRRRPSLPDLNSDDMVIRLEENFKIDSSNIENVYNLGFIYCSKCLQNINTDTSICLKAIHYFHRVKNLNKNFREAKAFYNSHLCLKKIGNREAALTDLDIFINKNLNNKSIGVNFFLKRAELLQESGRNAEACQDFNNALKLDTAGYYKVRDKILCK